MYAAPATLSARGGPGRRAGWGLLCAGGRAAPPGPRAFPGRVAGAAYSGVRARGVRKWSCRRAGAAGVPPTRPAESAARRCRDRARHRAGPAPGPPAPRAPPPAWSPASPAAASRTAGRLYTIDGHAALPGHPPPPAVAKCAGGGGGGGGVPHTQGRRAAGAKEQRPAERRMRGERGRGRVRRRGRPRRRRLRRRARGVAWAARRPRAPAGGRGAVTRCTSSHCGAPVAAGRTG
jgi:hypothetical protein